jgi:hypothetical protein
MEIFRMGSKVAVVTSPKCSPKIRVGTEGEIIGVRHGTNERLVKFVGKLWPVHVTTDEIKEA